MHSELSFADLRGENVETGEGSAAAAAAAAAGSGAIMDIMDQLEQFPAVCGQQQKMHVRS